MTATEFRSQFDADGRYHNGDGTTDVTFATRGGSRYPGRMVFKDGLCVRAEVDRGVEWANPDGSPLHGVRFLLDFGGLPLLAVAVGHGRISYLDEWMRRSTKLDFLTNFRIARNLFVHPQVEADSPAVDTSALAGTLARSAIWLTPKSVAGFNAADFSSDLGPEELGELQSAVNDFLAVARNVPPDEPATGEQFTAAAVAFRRMLNILTPYLPLPDESKQVEGVLRGVSDRFPTWVVNWDYELGTDAEGRGAVWVNVYADERSVPWSQLGRAAAELADTVHGALGAAGIDRWPYVRMMTAREHKAG